MMYGNEYTAEVVAKLEADIERLEAEDTCLAECEAEQKRKFLAAYKSLPAIRPFHLATKDFMQRIGAIKGE